MATLTFKGIDEYVAKLEQAEKQIKGIMKRALYDGAGELADEVRKEIQALPVQKANPPPGEQLNGVFGYEKEGLLNGLGVAKMRETDGNIQTRIFFDGYNRMKSKKYPNGHPNALIARSINAGTSVRMKIPFLNRAASKAKAKFEAAVKARFEADLNKIMK